MSEQTNIGWTDHTGGPWLICTEVSPGCANCYARELMLARLAPIVRKAYHRAGFTDWETRPVWGRNAPRVLTKGFWKEASALNRKAAAKVGGARLLTGQPQDTDGEERLAGTLAPPAGRPRMFPSLMDWLDDCPAGIINQEGEWLDVNQVRADFLKVIRTTPNLDWLLLTKRPEKFFPHLESVLEHLRRQDRGGDDLADWIENWRWIHIPPPNVWFGFSAENRDCLWKRWSAASKVPAVQHFVSLEPLLEDVAVTLETVLLDARLMGLKLWPIVGGESGAKRRDCGVDAIVNVARVCQEQNVPVYVKQDCAARSEQQGRIPDEFWKLKQFPDALESGE